MMGRKSKAPEVPKEFEGVELVVAYEAFVTTDELGQPIAVPEGDTFSPDHELVRRFGSYFFCPASTPSHERHQLKMRHYR